MFLSVKPNVVEIEYFTDSFVKTSASIRTLYHLHTCSAPHSEAEAAKPTRQTQRQGDTLKEKLGSCVSVSCLVFSAHWHWPFLQNISPHVSDKGKCFCSVEWRPVICKATASDSNHSHTNQWLSMEDLNICQHSHHVLVCSESFLEGDKK